MTAGMLPGAEPFSAALTDRLQQAVASRSVAAHAPRTRHRDDEGHPRFSNRLALETSPYLLQHAHNPVSWFPWGDEAFEEARRLRRPVFLSIGYSTCHWCHVMEEESFEDEEIAAFINMQYVAIKVDREERPDIDAVYMTAVQRLTGSGGWPMSVWLTAAREPFFGGTYFPPRDGARGARHGFLTVLASLADTFHREPARVAETAAALVGVVRAEMQGDAAGGSPADAAPSVWVSSPSSSSSSPSLDAAAAPTRQVIDETVEVLKRSFDQKNGGLRRAPKFPSHIPVRLLLRHHHRTGDADALAMAVLTLEKMAAGGLYDQLGGGFHRYSTDARWLVPHFEKMLYDNALLLVAYAEAFQVSGRADFARIMRETCDYLLREMTDPAGGFYSATDADSEGVEGKFFVWTADEIAQALDEDSPEVVGRSDRRALTRLFCEHYDVTAAGNWEGRNILNVPHPDEATGATLAGARARLYQVRAGRVPPLRDDKILAAWNGLAISALAIVGRVLDQPRYLRAAARAAAFVLEKMRDGEGRLFRSFKDGRPGHAAFLDDYAFLTAGLIDLFEGTFDVRWLREARVLADETERLFAAPAGGWFMTSGDHEVLIARERPAHDGAEPSGTSVALMNALRLGTFTGDDSWRRIAARGFAAHARVLRERPLVMTEGLLALDFFLDVPREIAVVWGEGGGAAALPLLSVLRRVFLPSRALAGAPESDVADAAAVVAFLRDKVARAGAPTAYVCRRGACELPVSDPSALEAQLRAGAAAVTS